MGVGRDGLAVEAEVDAPDAARKGKADRRIVATTTGDRGGLGNEGKDKCRSVEYTTGERPWERTLMGCRWRVRLCPVIVDGFPGCAVRPENTYLLTSTVRVEHRSCHCGATAH